MWKVQWAKQKSTKLCQLQFEDEKHARAEFFRLKSGGYSVGLFDPKRNLRDRTEDWKGWNGADD